MERRVQVAVKAAPTKQRQHNKPNKAPARPPRLPFPLLPLHPVHHPSPHQTLIQLMRPKPMLMPIQKTIYKLRARLVGRGY